MPLLRSHQIGRLDREAFNQRNTTTGNERERILDQLVEGRDIVCTKRLDAGRIGGKHLLLQFLVQSIWPLGVSIMISLAEPKPHLLPELEERRT